MKWALFLLILTFFSCAKFVARGPADEKVQKHIVFDIDWTIASEIKKPRPQDLKNPRVIEVQGTHYYISDGLEEFVEDILTHKEMHISFYSGGSKSRNEDLLSKIKLKNGKSLLDVSYKVLSKDDLVTIPNLPNGARFSERYRKDLRKISQNLDELIMLDDTANFVIDNSDNQSDHVFFIGKAFEYFEKYTDTEGKVGEFIPKSYEEWTLQRNRMYILNGVFNEAYAESISTGISFSESMKRHEELLNLKGQEWNIHSERLYKLYNLHKKTQQQLFIPDIRPARSDCQSLMAVFF